jgi:hypothetical protein
MSRSKPLLALAAFVVALGVAALLITGGIGGTRPTVHPIASPSPASVIAPVCPAQQIRLLGFINDCAGTLRRAPTGRSAPDGCRVSGRFLDAFILLQGRADEYLLYVEVDGSYVGPGDYSLPPWPQPSFHADDGVAKVAIRDYTTGDFWWSSFGVLTVSGNDGRSGLVTGDLEFAGGEPNPLPGLNISGAWNCG